MKTKILSILALLLSLIVGEVQAQRSLPSKHGFEQNGKSANARETFGQNRKSANAREVQSATTAQTPSRRSVLRAPSTDVLAPTDVTASGITGASATVSWNGTGDSYNLRYRKMYLSEDFESCSQNQLPAGWTALDADGDGRSWFTWDYTDFPNDKNHNPQSFDKKSVLSASYNEVTQAALTPNNWLISPQVPLKGKLSLWAKGVDPDYAAEHFAVYLSTTGKDVADFTTVLIPETAAQDVFTEYTADLSAYAGQVGYIAIRHFHISDMFQLAVDNITITDNWVEVDGVTSPYTLDGLDGLSSYEVEVQAVTGEQQSSWSTLRFNTLPPTYDLTLADGTEDATNWQGKAGEGEYQALPLEGVAAGTAVSVKYSGTKLVKSVKATKKANPYANAKLGDLFYSDGTFSTTLEGGKTPIGVIAYLGTDAFSENGTTVGGATFAGHGLVLCLKNAASGVAWSTNTSSQAYTDNALVTNAAGLKRSEGVSGYSATVALASSTDASTVYPAAYQAKNYTGLTAPAGTTGWFLPSAQQWVKMQTGLGELAESSIKWGEMYDTSLTAADKWDAALSKAGPGNYDSMKSGYLWYLSSSEYGDGNVVSLLVDVEGSLLGVGFAWGVGSKGGTDDYIRVRPVLAF